MKHPKVSNEIPEPKKVVCWGFVEDEILPSYVGITINQVILYVKLFDSPKK